MIIKSSGDMSLESLPPDGDDRWKSFLDDYNALKRDCVRVTRRLNLQDNTHNREKSVNLVHGVETEIAVPEDVEGRVKTVVALQVEGLTLDSTGKPNGSVYALGLASPVEWRHSDTDGKVFVRAKFSPPVGEISLSNAAAFSVPYNSLTTITWDTENYRSGALSNSAGVITASAAGRLLVTYSGLFDTANGGRRQFALISGSTTRADSISRNGDGYFGAAGAAEFEVAAAATLSLKAFQDQTAAVALNLLAARSRLTARFVAPTVGTTGRVNLLFVGE